MKMPTPSYQRHRFPSEIISHAVWLYHRFCLSFREVEELLAERGITVTYESVRQWCRKFGPAYARKLKKQQGRLGDVWYLDEVFRHCQLKSNWVDFLPRVSNLNAEQSRSDEFVSGLIVGHIHLT